LFCDVPLSCLAVLSYATPTFVPGVAVNIQHWYNQGFSFRPRSLTQNCKERTIFNLHSHKPKNIPRTTTATMKSTSQAQNTGTPPLTLIDAMMHSALSNAAGSPALPLPITSYSPETRAVGRTRLLTILDSVIALIDEDEDDFSTNAMFESNSTLKRRPLQ
jgi:hypothetical protein